MKRLTAALLIFIASVPVLAGQRAQGPRAQLVGPGERARPATTDGVNNQLIQELYISEFRRQVGINDEQLAGKFRPILMQWLQQRRNVITRRNESVAVLRQLVTSNAPEGEITRQIAEVDQAENQTRNAERRLLAQVDPMLTPMQQARFRIFQVDMEQRIRELLDNVRQQPAPQPNPQRAVRPGR